MSRKESKRSPSMSIGSSSILAIFVLLILTTFATLTLLSANADYKLSTKVANAQQEFYEGEAAAEQTLYSILRELASGTAPNHATVIAQGDTFITVEYFTPISEHRQLRAQIRFLLEDTITYEKLLWQVEAV